MERVARCGCGNVQITVKNEPQDCWVCHCDYCQRSTGTIGVFAAVFLEEDVVSIEGNTTKFDDLPKWPGAERHFCSTCGTTVHWINPGSLPGKRLIAAGCFADPDFSIPALPGPTRSMQTQHRPDWCGDFSGAQSFKAYPE